MGPLVQGSWGADPGLVGRPCVAENVLADGGEVGFEHPGGYAECFLTEARSLHPLPAGLGLETAALIEQAQLGGA